MDITMPQLGETVTEGTITRWYKQVGERVDADEPLFEVSTDKVDSEVPAPVDGVLTEILVAEGETVAVGTRLAVVSGEAEGMVRSSATSPRAYTSVEVDFENVERVRSAHGEHLHEAQGAGLGYLPFVVRAFSAVAHEFPHVNASVQGESLVVHRHIHLGVAIDLDDEELVVPVIRDVDAKDLKRVSAEVRDGVARARTRTLSPDELAGATFTIADMSTAGTLLTLPIIDQPQVATLTLDTVRKQPVVIEEPGGEDRIAVHHVGHLALAWDHRAFDGAYAAAFLGALRDAIERRAWDSDLA